MADNKKLYDNLLKSGKISQEDIGDFATFDSLLKTPENATLLYNNLRKDDLFTEDELGDSTTFMSNLSFEQPKQEVKTSVVSVPKETEQQYQLSFNKKPTLEDWANKPEKTPQQITAEKTDTSEQLVQEVEESAKKVIPKAEKRFVKYETEKTYSGFKETFPESSKDINDIINMSESGNPELQMQAATKWMQLNKDYSMDARYPKYWNDYVDDTGITSTIKSLINDTNNIKNVAEELKQRYVPGKIVKEIGIGFENYLKQYTELNKKIDENEDVKNLIGKLKEIQSGKDIQLTEEEGILLQAFDENIRTHEGMVSELPKSYDWATSTGYSLGFMAEFIASFTIAGKAIKPLKAIMTAGKIGGAVEGALSPVSMGMIKLAQAGIQPIATPAFWRRIAEKRADGTSLGRAALESWDENFREIITESMFMNPSDKVAKGLLNKFFKAAGVTLTTESGVTGFIKNAFEQYAEEKMADIYDAPRDNKNFRTFFKQFINKQDNINTFMSVAFISGAMSAPIVAKKSYDKVRSDIVLNGLQKKLPKELIVDIDIILKDKSLTNEEIFGLVSDAVDARIADGTISGNLPNMTVDVVKYTLESIKKIVRENIDKAKPEEIFDKEIRIGEPEKKTSETLKKPVTGYLYGKTPIEETEAINKIDESETEKELDEVKLPPESPLAERVALKKAQFAEIKTIEDKKTADIESAQGDQVKIDEIESNYQKSLDDINQRYVESVQNLLTVKEKTGTELTEKKTEISETQPTETKQVAKSEQKVETVKEGETKKVSKFDNLTKALNITEAQEGLENAKVGKVGKATVILAEGKNENEVVLESIQVPQKQRNKGKELTEKEGVEKKGYGTQALKQVLREADNQGLTVRLKAVPQEGSGITQQQLINWYKDNDFEFEEGKIEGIRKPHAIIQTAEGERIDINDQIKTLSKNAPNAAKSVVVDDEAEIEKLSKDARESNVFRNNKGKIEAIYDPNLNGGTVFFMKRAIKSEGDIVRLWAHEQGTHRGLDVLFPDKKKKEKLLLKVFDSIDWDALKEDKIIKPYLSNYDNSEKTAEDKATLAEEYLAKLAEKIIKKQDLTPQEKSVWDKFVDWMNDVISETFGKTKLSQDEIADIVRGSVKSLYTPKKETTKTKEIKPSIKEGGTQNAEEIRKSTEKTGTEKGTEGRTGKRLRLRDDAKNWVETGKREGIKFSIQEYNPYEMRLNEKGDLVVAPIRSPHFANMTMDDKGNFIFFHRTPFKFDTIDPKKYGSNPAMVTSQSEITAIAKVGGLSMFYLNQNQSETMVTGEYTYAFAIPMNQVYDYDLDPKGYKPLAEKRHNEEYASGFDRNASLAYVTKIASENGYKITVTHWWASDSRAQTALPLKVSDFLKLNGQIVVKDFDNKYIPNDDFGYVPVWTKTKDQKLGFIYEKIHKEFNARQLYSDPLYRIYMYTNMDFPDKPTIDLPFTSEKQMTEAVMSSPYLSGELKNEYQEAVNFKTEKGYSVREGVKKIGNKILIPFEVKTEISSDYKNLYDLAKKALVDGGMDEKTADITIRDAIFEALQKVLPEILKSEGITNEIKLTKDIGGYSGGIMYQINPNILVEFDIKTTDDVLVDVMNALNKASVQEMANAFRTPTADEIKNKDKDVFPTLTFERPEMMGEEQFKSMMMELANIVDENGNTPLTGFTKFDKFVNISGYFYNKFNKSNTLEFLDKNFTKLSIVLQKYGVSLRTVNIDYQKVFSYNGIYEREGQGTDGEVPQSLGNRPEDNTREERLFQQASHSYNGELQKIIGKEAIKLSIAPDFKEDVFDRIVKTNLLSEQQVKDLRDKLNTKTFSKATKEKQTLEIVKSLIKSSTGITKKTYKELGNIVADLFRGLSKAEKKVIPPRQYISIIGRLGQANTVRTMNKLLNDVFDKYIFGDGAKYKAALAEATKALQSIIDANQTNKSKFGTAKNVADEVSNIDLNKLTFDELKDFTKLANRIFRTKRTPSVEYIHVINSLYGNKQNEDKAKVERIKDIDDLQKYVDKASEIEVVDIGSYIQLNRRLNLARKRAIEIFSELADTDENNEARSDIEEKIGNILNRGEEIGGEFQEQLDDFKNAYADFIASKLRSQETKNGIDLLETKEEKLAGMELYSMPLSAIRKLDINSMADLSVAIDNLRIGDLMPYTFHELYPKLHAIDKKDKFLKQALTNISNSKRWKTLIERGLKAFTFSKKHPFGRQANESDQLLFELMKLQAFRMDMFLGNVSLTKTFSRVFSEIGDAINRMNSLKSKTDEMMYNAYVVFSKKIKTNKLVDIKRGEDKQLIWRKLLGMFMIERRWQSSKFFDDLIAKGELSEETASYLNNVLNINKESSLRHATDSKSFNEDADIFNRLIQIVRDNNAFKKIGDVEVIDIDKLESILRKDEGVDVFLTTVDKIFEEYKGKNKMSSLFNDRSLNFGENFFPFRSKDKRNQIDDNNILPEFMRVASNAKLQSGSTYEWTGKRMYIETDITNVVNSYTEGIRRNYFLYPLLRENTMAIRMASSEVADGNTRVTGNDNRITMLGNTIVDALLQRLAMYYKTGVYHKERKAFDLFEKGSKKAMLAKPAKMITETTANIIRMTMAMKDLPIEVYTRIAENKEFYNEFVGNYIGDKYFSRWADEVNDTIFKHKWLEFAENAADFLISFADKSVGKALFTSYFTDKFKELTGEEFSEKDYQNEEWYKLKFKDAIDESAALGLRRVEELFNNKNPMSNAQYVSFFNGILSWRADSGMARVFNFLMSFGRNEANQIIDSYRRYVWAGRGSKERMMAKRDIMAVVTSNFLYGILRKMMSITGGIILAQVSGIFSGGGGGDDDKYIDEQKQQLKSGKFYFDYGTKRIALDLILGGSANIFESVSTFSLYFLENTGGLDKKTAEWIYEQFNIRYMDRMPLYGMSDRVIIEATPAGLQPIAKDFFSTGESLFDFVVSMCSAHENGLLSEKDLYDLVNLWNMGMKYVFFSPTVPIVERKVNQNMYRLRKEHKKEKAKEKKEKEKKESENKGTVIRKR